MGWCSNDVIHVQGWCSAYFFLTKTSVLEQASMRQEHGEFYSRGLVLYPIVLQEGPTWYCNLLYCRWGLVLYPIVLQEGPAWYCNLLYCRRGLVLYPIVLQEGPGTVPYCSAGGAWYCTLLYCRRVPPVTVTYCTVLQEGPGTGELCPVSVPEVGL